MNIKDKQLRQTIMKDVKEWLKKYHASCGLIVIGQHEKDILKNDIINDPKTGISRYHGIQILCMSMTYSLFRLEFNSDVPIMYAGETTEKEEKLLKNLSTLLENATIEKRNVHQTIFMIKKELENYG